VGINQKSLAAVLGCIGGVTSTALLTVLMTKILSLTGVVDSEALYLVYLRDDNPIDLKAIVFAGIVIGAVGDVTAKPGNDCCGTLTGNHRQLWYYAYFAANGSGMRFSVFA